MNSTIQRSGWAGLRQMLYYKATKVIEVPAAYALQTCASCGFSHAGSSGAQASCKCVACGLVLNADLNAVRSILASGTGAAARRGASPTGTPGNHEEEHWGNCDFSKSAPN